MTVELISSSPSQGEFGVSPTSGLFIVLDSVHTVDPLTVDVTIGGSQAIVDGIFQTGWTGTVLNNGTTVEITISTPHPGFDKNPVEVGVYAEDGAAEGGNASFFFVAALGEISGLTAKSDCEGEGIYLAWTNPPGATQLKILRSPYAYYTEAGMEWGDVVYEGVLKTTHTDTNLQPNQFYYYTFFVSFSASAPYTWVSTEGGMVEGLSIRDYRALALSGGIENGDYVYALLPEDVRRQDAAEERGADRYLMRDYCAVIQCGINIYRGWAEGIVHTKDPDMGSLGRVGEAENQFGTFRAYVRDLGVDVEGGFFDSAALRRLVTGITMVNQSKGTCVGLTTLARLLTTWETRCYEAITPVCGINRLMTLWDGESYLGFKTGIVEDPVLGPTGAVIDGSTPGVLKVTKTILDGSGATLDVPTTASGELTVSGILTSLGDFLCVSSVEDGGSTWDFTLTQPTSYARAEIRGSGTGAATEFIINEIDLDNYPWQFPNSIDGEPLFGLNAFLGMELMDSAGDVFDITANTGTDEFGDTVLTLASGTPATGVFSIANSFSSPTTYADRKPVLTFRFIVGELSFLPHTIWDTRLLREGELGPWSVLSGLGAISGLSWAPTPADVTLYVKNQHRVKGFVESVTTNTLTDSTQTWTINAWSGHYLIPNTNTRRLYRIVSNTSDTLVLAVSGAGVDTLTAPGLSYVVLTEENAKRYMRLTTLMDSYVPVDSFGYVKFEEDSSTLVPLNYPRSILWLRADKVVLDDSGNVLVWPDLSASRADFLPDSAATAPGFTESNADFNNQPTVDFNGTTQRLRHTAGNLTTTELSCTLMLVVKAANTNIFQMLLDAETGRLGFSWTGSSALNALYNGSTYTHLTGSVPGTSTRVLFFDVDSAADLVNYLESGDFLSEAFTDSRILGGDVSIGSIYDGSASYFQGSIAEVVLYEGRLSPSERFLLTEAAQARYT